jgi:hypothetical protein
MKERMLFVLLTAVLLIQNAGVGQTPYSWRTFWPNNIRTFLNSNGVVFADTTRHHEGLLWPGTTNNPLVFSSGLWVSGRDDQGSLRTSLSYLKSFYQPGRINGVFDDTNLGVADPPSDPRFKMLILADTTSESDAEYQRWVADAPVTGAPLDKEGQPLRLGALNAYWLMNDLDTTYMRQYIPHAPRPMGLEISTYAFAYNDGSVLSDAIFLVMNIRNKSVHTYDSTYLGWWSDIDLGRSISNYPGCDSTLSLGYVYSSLDSDMYYGTAVPACGFILLEAREVNSLGRAMTSFMKNVDQAGTPYVLPQPGDSVPDSQFAFVLRGRLLDGTPLTPPGEPGNIIAYVNPGDPIDGTGWLATQDYGGATDCKILLGSGPAVLAPGDSIRFVVAFLVAQDSDRLSSIRKLKDSVPSVVGRWNGLTSSGGGDVGRSIPVACLLDQNFPNPFNPSTTIRYALAERSHVMLTVFNTLGQLVATLTEGETEAGYHEVTFDASRLPSGVYLYRLLAGNHSEVRKALLMK